MNKILIVKTSALGDIVQTYPVLEYLRRRFPSAQIDWIVEEPFADLVKSHPSVSQVKTIATKRWKKNLFQSTTYRDILEFRQQLRQTKYDLVLDLQGNVKSGLVLSQVKSPLKVGFSHHSVSEWPNILFTNRRYNPPPSQNIRSDYLSIAKALFSDSTSTEVKFTRLNISQGQSDIISSILKSPVLQQKRKVIVCPGSAWTNKQLTPETLLDFLAKIHETLDCAFLLVWGSPQEKELVSLIHQQFPISSQIIDKMTLPMLQNLMDECDLILAMDSLPLHLAGTTSTPSFSFFGPSLAQKYKPLGKQHHAYQGQCPYGRSFTKRCPILRTCPSGACIHNLASANLFNSFLNWWQDLS